MKRKLLIAGALFGALSHPYAAYAEALHSQSAKSPKDGDVSRWLTPMELLIVTPTRMPQPLNQTIADTTVLTEQDIRKSGAPDVPTLLRSLPGVEVTQSGGLGSQSSVFMRGTNSNQVLVLLDGVRINSATTGTTALEHIMLDDVERIEVVRGNVSSLYGSEAIGGVIQIFTKQGHGAPTINASAGIGSHGTQRLTVGYSGSVDNTSFGVNAGKVKTDGVSAMNPLLMPGANPNNNGYDNDTLDAQVKHHFSTNHSVSASVFATRGNTSFDNPYWPVLPTDLNNTIESIDKFSLASEDQLSGMWHSLLLVAQGTDDSHSYTNGVQSSRFKTQNNQLTWQNNFKIADSQHVDLALEHLGQVVSADTLFTQTSRNVNSLLGGYVGGFGAQQVQINLRQDRYSDFGEANTGLFGYGLLFANNWRVTASVSNAFKAPTFNDMYFPFQSYGGGYTYSGNPNLQPERSQNSEAGLHFSAHGQRVDAVYFDNRISDLITCNAACSTVVNINQAQIDGEELSYAGEFGNTRLKANATFQNPRNSVTGRVLLRRAKKFANMVASHDLGAWNMGAEVRYSGARQDFDFNGNPVTLNGYTLLNLTASYRIDKSLNVSAHMDNLFNRDYSEVYGYNTLGRTLFVGFHYLQ